MTKRRRLSLGLPLPLLAVVGVLLPISRSDAPPQSAAEAAYHALPSQPVGDAERGRAGVERTALAVATWLRAVPVAAGSSATCAPDQLRVSWSEPSPDAKVGGYVPPLGPAPGDATTAVNGIVVCATSDYAYMGFEARYANARWDVVSVPSVALEDEQPPTVPEPSVPSPVDVATLDGRTFGPDIEAPAAYEPQRTCDATPKVGTVALKNLLLKTFAGSRTLGIGTGCDGTVSEHHEGRAFDWGVRVTVPSEKAMAQSFIDTVLARDRFGNEFALARRIGIMYMIWDHHIWSTYRASEGWRPYSGASPHTDHIHISMSWAGALGRTSFWSGNVAQVLAASTPRGAGGASTQVAAVRPRTTTTAPHRSRNVTIDTQLTADRQARDDARRAEWAERLARRRASTTTTSTTAPTSTTMPDDATTTSSTWRVRTPRPTTTTTTVRPTTTTTTVRPTTTTTVRPTTTTTVRPASATTTTTVPRWRRLAPTTTTTVRPTTTTTVRPTTTTVAPTTSTSGVPATTSTTAH